MQNKGPGTIQDIKHLTDPHLWVATYADYLYNYAVARVAEEELARDLVQETFLAALEQREKFEGRSTERTWLTAILKNKIIDVYRKKASGLAGVRKQESGDTELNEFFQAKDGHWKEAYYPQEFSHSADDPLLSKEFNTVLKHCMKKLPALWLAVFTMKHMDDASTEMICSELKVSAANFWVIIHRAKLNLRACLQKKWI